MTLLGLLREHFGRYWRSREQLQRDRELWKRKNSQVKRLSWGMAVIRIHTQRTLDVIPVTLPASCTTGTFRASLINSGGYK